MLPLIIVYAPMLLLTFSCYYLLCYADVAICDDASALRCRGDTLFFFFRHAALSASPPMPILLDDYYRHAMLCHAA